MDFLLLLCTPRMRFKVPMALLMMKLDLGHFSGVVRKPQYRDWVFKEDSFDREPPSKRVQPLGAVQAHRWKSGWLRDLGICDLVEE